MEDRRWEGTDPTALWCWVFLLTGTAEARPPSLVTHGHRCGASKDLPRQDLLPNAWERWRTVGGTLYSTHADEPRRGLGGNASLDFPLSPFPRPPPT